MGDEVQGSLYNVILRPSDVKFTSPTIPTTLDDGSSLLDVLKDISKGRKSAKDIPTMKVMKM